MNEGFLKQRSDIIGESFSEMVTQLNIKDVKHLDQ